MSYKNLYIGKYKAKVVEVKGKKIRVECEKIWGDYTSPWCEPCVPILADKGMYRVPKVKESVWIECAEGDSNKPIWVGLTSF